MIQSLPQIVDPTESGVTGFAVDVSFFTEITAYCLLHKETWIVKMTSHDSSLYVSVDLVELLVR